MPSLKWIRPSPASEIGPGPRPHAEGFDDSVTLGSPRVIHLSQYHSRNRLTIPASPIPMPRLRFLSHIPLIALLLAAPPAVYGAGSRLNKDAQALARHLAPTPAAKSFKGDTAGALGKRMAPLLEILERSYRTNGPGPESLISKAYSFRDDLGRYEEVMLANALLSAWREANALGLFDESGRFRPEVAKGRGVGDKVLFELIVPGEAYPPGSNQLANLRLVRLDEKRKPDAELTLRESATLEQLRKMVEEKENLTAQKKWENPDPTNALGQTKEEHLYIWENEVARAGEAVKQLPTVRIRADIEATPSRMTEERWRLGCEVGNLSRHPTEVKLEVYLIGITDRKRDHYIMMKSEQSLKLRAGEMRNVDIFSRAKQSYKKPADDHDQVPKKERKYTKVRFRGYAVRVSHEKGLVTFVGSDQRIAGYVDPSVESLDIGKLPQF